MTTQTLDLKARWADLRTNKPNLRIRDAADELGVSEAELLSTRCGESVNRLEGDWSTLIKEFPRLGKIMCLTRNNVAVHERYGIFQDISFFHGMGQVVGTDIDLRLFMSEWQLGFAVTDETKEGERHSFQFFDASGTAIHKVYLTSESSREVYSELLSKFLSANQSPEQTVVAFKPSVTEKSDSEIDTKSFQEAWLALKDTHDFFLLLKKFGVTRTQALRLAPEGYAYRVASTATQQMLETAAKQHTHIMVFIGSAGCIQIHTGKVTNIKRFGNEWLNILDEQFNMHLREPLVSSSWVVKKATKDGVVTSLELFDESGENIALFFGKRKPGQSEDSAWREIIAALPKV